MSLRDIFVIMPFGEETITLAGKKVTYAKSHYDDVYDLIRETVLEHDASCRVDRMEQKHGNLVQAIIRRIHSADLVIAVLSGRNPNVFYELGVRHALKRGTIMLVADRNEYPFDLRGYYSEQYSLQTRGDQRALKEFLLDRLKAYEADPTIDDSPVLDVLEINEREQWSAINHWETRRAAVVLWSVLGDLRSLYVWSEDWRPHFEAWVSTIHEGESPPLPRPLTLPALRNFVGTFPVIGLPSAAYVDAENTLNRFDDLQRAVSVLSEYGSPSSSRESRLGSTSQVIERMILCQRTWALFARDVSVALEYLISERKCYGLPWAESVDLLDNGISNPEFETITTELNNRLNELAGRYLKFEREFSGSPFG